MASGLVETFSFPCFITLGLISMKAREKNDQSPTIRTFYTNVPYHSEEWLRLIRTVGVAGLGVAGFDIPVTIIIIIIIYSSSLKYWAKVLGLSRKCYVACIDAQN